MPEADTTKKEKQYYEDIPMATQGFFLKGAGSLDWGMKNRLARIFNPQTSRTVMLAVDHGYFLGPTTGLDDPGATVEQFDLPHSSARKRVTAFIQQMVKVRLERRIIPGTRFRNIHAAAVLRRLVTRRFAFPSYVMAYRYRGLLYRVVLSGQDGACVIGTAPYSVIKILALVFGGALALAFIAALIAVL